MIEEVWEPPVEIEVGEAEIEETEISQRIMTTYFPVSVDQLRVQTELSQFYRTKRTGAAAKSKDERRMLWC